MPTHKNLAWADIPDATMNNVFPDGQVGGSTDYGWIVVYNPTGGTITTVRSWLEVDPAGAAIAAQVADVTPRPSGYVWSATPPGSGWSTPTASSPLTLPDIPTGQGVLVVLRRTLTGAAAAWPEVNAFVSSATEPI